MFKKQVTICAVLFILLSFAGCAKGFERNSVIAAAKKDGMRSITLAGYEKLCQGGTFYEDVEKYYYVAKDSEEANYVYHKYVGLEENDNVTLNGFVECRDETFMDYCLFTAADNESANKLYDEFVEYCKEDDPVISSGKKGGYIYTIGYISSKDAPGKMQCFGIYKKGKTVFVISANADTAEERERMESVFKGLGLISPLTLLSK